MRHEEYVGLEKAEKSRRGDEARRRRSGEWRDKLEQAYHLVKYYEGGLPPTFLTLVPDYTQYDSEELNAILEQIVGQRWEDAP